MPEFWVNVDGLSASANGFDDAADRVREIQSDFSAGVGPLGSPWGTGPSGTAFAEGFLPSVTLYHQGLQTWEKALRQTSDGVSTMADNFGETEDANERIAGELLAPPPGAAQT